MLNLTEYLSCVSPAAQLSILSTFATGQCRRPAEWIVGSPYSEAEEQLLKKKTFFHSKWVVSNLNIMTNRVFVPNWKIMKGHVAVAFVSTKDDIYPSGLGSL